MTPDSDIYTIENISQLMRYLELPTPLHPLIALVDYNNISVDRFEKGKKISIDFYKISFKTQFSGQIRYGQEYYDFEEGGLAFLKPKQIVTAPANANSYEGYSLYFHPDFIRNYSLGNLINQYGFFPYDVTEALFLSAKEKNVISNLFSTVATELENNIDQFSQDVLVTQIELLLNYSNRFYNRQFITRKATNHETIRLLDELLDDYFDKDKGFKNGLPSVQYVSTKLNVSTHYLSDMLGLLTRQNTQQYIQNKVIEQSKTLLSTTILSVAEIAYQLGFEHPQSFSKLFKSRINQTPLEYRHSFS